MTNVPEGPAFYVLFVVIPALFVSLVGAGLTKAIEREKIPDRKIIFAVILTIVSLAVAAFLHVNRFPENLIAGLIALLWFPLAVIIASLGFRDLPCRNDLPSLVFVITFVVYNIEEGLFYLGRWAGLRDAGILPFPPVPMTYELMLWPVWFHAVVQFFLTLILAGILVAAVRRYPGLWEAPQPPAS